MSGVEHALPAHRPAAIPYGLNSETGVLRHVLLGAPDHFAWRPVSAVARQTLSEGRSFDKAVALTQHGEMVAAYEAAGVTCHYLPARPHNAYAVFARDSSFMTPWGAVITMIQTPYRRGDYALALEFYERMGIPVWKMVTAGHFEGGDLHIVKPGLVFCGYGGERSEASGAEEVAGWFRAMGWEAHAVPFPPYFVHLDVSFAMAAPSLAAVCEDALPDWFLTVLAEHQIRTLPVSYREAMSLGCNIVALGDGRVLSTRNNTELNAKMKAEGLTVYDPDLSLFTLGGGGPHCLCQGLHRDPL
ncbi:MAG: arginine deiminase family protein [Pseudomonadota bacterium]